jgi:glycosyltransferase involved in cell wall biosynthesis
MRLAWVVTGGFDRSGRERVIPILLTIVERLARRHDVHVFVLRYGREAESYSLLGATIHDLGRPRGLWRQYAALVHALRKFGPFDLLHGYWAMPAGLVATLAGRRLRVPAIVTLSSGELVAIPDIEYGLQRRVATRLAVAATVRLATRVTVATEYMSALARTRGFTTDRLPLGVDVARFVPRDRDEGPPWRLLDVASLNRVKDQAMLLDAMRRLIDRVPDVHLDIVGEDTLGGELQRTAARLGLDRHITFHGFVSSDALVTFYQRAHLLVTSSRHEASGVVVLEAAACGVPTVGTAVGYVADWTQERAVGVPVRDVVALADAIAALLHDPERRKRIASAAREWVVGHDADWSVAELENLYADAAKSRGR